MCRIILITGRVEVALFLGRCGRITECSSTTYNVTFTLRYRLRSLRRADQSFGNSCLLFNNCTLTFTMEAFLNSSFSNAIAIKANTTYLRVTGSNTLCFNCRSTSITNITDNNTIYIFHSQTATINANCHLARFSFLLTSYNSLFRNRFCARSWVTTAIYTLYTTATSGATRSTRAARVATRGVSRLNRSIISIRTTYSTRAAVTTWSNVSRLIMTNTLILVTRGLMNFNDLFRFLFYLFIAEILIKIVLTNFLTMYLFCLVVQYNFYGSGCFMVVSF